MSIDNIQTNYNIAGELAHERQILESTQDSQQRKKEVGVTDVTQVKTQAEQVVELVASIPMPDGSPGSRVDYKA